jgi:hypothetical protein
MPMGSVTSVESGKSKATIISNKKKNELYESKNLKQFLENLQARENTTVYSLLVEAKIVVIYFIN